MRFIRNALIFATATYTLSGCGDKEDKKEVDDETPTSDDHTPDKEAEMIKLMEKIKQLETAKGAVVGESAKQVAEYKHQVQVLRHQLDDTKANSEKKLTEIEGLTKQRDDEAVGKIVDRDVAILANFDNGETANELRIRIQSDPTIKGRYLERIEAVMEENRDDLFMILSLKGWKLWFENGGKANDAALVRVGDESRDSKEPETKLVIAHFLSHTMTREELALRVSEEQEGDVLAGLRFVKAHQLRRALGISNSDVPAIEELYPMSANDFVDIKRYIYVMKLFLKRALTAANSGLIEGQLLPRMDRVKLYVEHIPYLGEVESAFDDMNKAIGVFEKQYEARVQRMDTKAETELKSEGLLELKKITDRIGIVEEEIARGGINQEKLMHLKKGAAADRMYVYMLRKPYMRVLPLLDPNASQSIKQFIATLLSSKSIDQLRYIETALVALKKQPDLIEIVQKAIEIYPEMPIGHLKFTWLSKNKEEKLLERLNKSIEPKTRARQEKVIGELNPDQLFGQIELLKQFRSGYFGVRKANEERMEIINLLLKKGKKLGVFDQFVQAHNGRGDRDKEGYYRARETKMRQWFDRMVVADAAIRAAVSPAVGNHFSKIPVDDLIDQIRFIEWKIRRDGVRVGVHVGVHVEKKEVVDDPEERSELLKQIDTLVGKVEDVVKENLPNLRELALAKALKEKPFSEESLGYWLFNPQRFNEALKFIQGQQRNMSAAIEFLKAHAPKVDVYAHYAATELWTLEQEEESTHSGAQEVVAVSMEPIEKVTEFLKRFRTDELVKVSTDRELRSDWSAEDKQHLFEILLLRAAKESVNENKVTKELNSIKSYSDIEGHQLLQNYRAYWNPGVDASTQSTIAGTIMGMFEEVVVEEEEEEE